MTTLERDAILDTVDEAVVGCELLKPLTYAYRLDVARLVRRHVAARIAGEPVEVTAATKTPLPEQ